MPKKKNTEHCVMRNGNPFCLNCGRTYEMKLPVPAHVAIGMINGFVKTHADCEKTWQEPTPDGHLAEKERAEFWLRNGEQGSSSKTMFEVFSGQPMLLHRDRSHPHDPSDFRRCHLLLETIPQWRNRLPELKTLGDPWPALVHNWEALTEMLKEQLKTKKPNGMYELMKKLGC